MLWMRQFSSRLKKPHPERSLVGGGRSTIEVWHAQRDDEVQSYITYGGTSHFEMDDAFCARMCAAIEAGLESAPVGVVTAPGTQSPRYVSNLTAKYHRPRDER